MQVCGRHLDTNENTNAEKGQPDQESDGITLWPRVDAVTICWLVCIRLCAFVLSIYTAHLYIYQHDTWCELTDSGKKKGLSSREVWSSRWGYSFTHLTIWWNLLAVVCIVCCLASGILMSIETRGYTRAPTEGHECLDRFVSWFAALSEFLMQVQHPFSWVVFLGYWYNTFQHMHRIGSGHPAFQFHLPGVTCRASTDSKEIAFCERQIYLDLLLHLAMPLIMMHQLDGINTKLSSTSLVGVVLFTAMYTSVFVGFTLGAELSPYADIDMNNNRAYMDYLIFLCFLVVRLVLSNHSVSMSL